MRFVIGGLGQGQLDYVLKDSTLTLNDVADGECCTLAEAAEKRIITNLHLLIKRLMQKGENTEVIFSLIDESKIVITDEIGGGLVPVDAFERAWRENVGRICGRLAQQAQLVERVYCGLATVLKGELDA